MASSKELFHLIQSLTTAEKAYFKKQSSFGSSALNKGYIKLFDILAGLGQYDEEIIKKKSEKFPFSNYLSKAKNQLYHSILKTLRGFYLPNSIDLQLQEIIQEVELLYNKALISLCMNTIKKGKEIARERERFLYYLLFMDWELRAMSWSIENTWTEQFYEELRTGIRLFANYIETYESGNKVKQLLYSTDADSRKQRESNELIDTFLMKDVTDGFSARAQTVILGTKFIVYMKRNQLSNMYDQKAAHLGVFEQHSFLKTDFPVAYLGALSNTALTAIELYKYKEALSFIDKLEHFLSTIRENRAFLKIKGMEFIDSLKLSLCIIKGETNNTVIQIRQVESHLSVYKTNSLFSWNECIYDIAYALFTMGEFKKSRKYIFQIVHEAEGKMNENYLLKYKLLGAITNYELEDYDLLEHSIQQLNKFFDTPGSQDCFEKQLLVLLRNTLEVATKSEKIKLFDKYLRSQKTDKIITRLIGIDYTTWLTAKAKNTLMSNIYLEKFKQSQNPG